MEIDERDEPVCGQMWHYGVVAFTSCVGGDCEQHEETQRCCGSNEERDDRTSPHHAAVDPLSEIRRCRVIPETSCETTCKKESVGERRVHDCKRERVYRSACHDRSC